MSNLPASSERFRPGSLHKRYFETLGRLMSELASEGDVLLVGRGGSRLLRDTPRAFHVRLVAPLPVRLRRVMEYRWLAEEPARKLIAESDALRHRFYEDYFGADWSDPLEYDVTVNSGRLGPTAVDLVAFAAEPILGADVRKGWLSGPRKMPRVARVNRAHQERSAEPEDRLIDLSLLNE